MTNTTIYLHSVDDEQDNWQGDGAVKVPPVPDEVSYTRQQHVPKGKGHREQYPYCTAVFDAARLDSCNRYNKIPYGIYILFTYVVLKIIDGLVY